LYCSAPHILALIKIKEDEMGEVLGRRKLSEGGHCEAAGVDGRCGLD
jgi:hypothetical protein